jgi:hypothetical protein
MLAFLHPSRKLAAFNDPNELRRARLVLSGLFVYGLLESSKYIGTLLFHEPCETAANAGLKVAFCAIGIVLGISPYYFSLFRGYIYCATLFSIVRTFQTGHAAASEAVLDYLFIAVLSPAILSWIFSFRWLLVFLPLYVIITIAAQVISSPFSASDFTSIMSLIIHFHVFGMMTVWLQNSAEQETRAQTVALIKARDAAVEAAKYKSQFVATMSYVTHGRSCTYW